MAKTREQLFINQNLRGIARTTLLLKAQIDEVVERYPDLTFPMDATIVDDTRTGEGYEALTGADIQDNKTLLVAIRAAFTGNDAGLTATRKLYPNQIVS